MAAKKKAIRRKATRRVAKKKEPGKRFTNSNNSTVRLWKLTDREMSIYRKPFLDPGESRRPTLTWPRQIPVDGEPEDVTAIIQSYGTWLAKSMIPKLFVNADPGSILVGPQREFCRTWPNQTEITVPGLHFIQEDSPKEIGFSIRNFLSSIS